MSKWPKIFLAISVTSFVFGLTSMGSEFAYGILKPVGAIMFGVFFITQILDKEIAQYDEEMRSKLPEPSDDKAQSARPTPSTVDTRRLSHAA